MPSWQLFLERLLGIVVASLFILRHEILAEKLEKIVWFQENKLFSLPIKFARDFEGGFRDKTALDELCKGE